MVFADDSCTALFFPAPCEETLPFWLLSSAISSNFGNFGSCCLIKSFNSCVQPSWRIKSQTEASSSPIKHISVGRVDLLKGPTLSLFKRSRGTEGLEDPMMLQNGSTSREVPMTMIRSAFGKSRLNMKKRFGKSSPKKVMSGFTSP